MSRAHAIVFVLANAVAFISVANGGALLPRKTELDGRIVGGEAAQIQNFPWQLSVEHLNRHICGGVIIGKTYVLTACHCVALRVAPILYRVKYGVTFLNDSGTTIQVLRIIRHAQYNPATLNNDIAMLVLVFEIDYSNNAQPIAMISSVPGVGIEGVVTGWGSTSEGGSISNELQKVTVTVTDQTKCDEKYKEANRVTGNMLCAGEPEGGKDSCQGDSGGPLVLEHQLAGLVSWGYGCGRPGYPGVYTNIANYKQWVKDHIEEK